MTYSSTNGTRSDFAAMLSTNLLVDDPFVARALRPNMKQFMQATGASAADASEMLYGVIGDNVDMRNWGAIMASSNPVAAVRAATFQLYNSDLNYALGQHSSFGTDGYIEAVTEQSVNIETLVAQSGNFALSAIDGRASIDLITSEGLLLRVAGSSAEEIGRAAWLHGFNTGDLVELLDRAAELDPELASEMARTMRATDWSESSVQAVQTLKDLSASVNEKALSANPTAVVDDGAQSNEPLANTFVDEQVALPIEFKIKYQSTTQHPLSGRDMYSAILIADDNQMFRSGPHYSKADMKDDLNLKMAELNASRSGETLTVAVNYGTELVSVSPDGTRINITQQVLEELLDGPQLLETENVTGTIVEETPESAFMVSEGGDDLNIVTNSLFSSATPLEGSGFSDLTQGAQSSPPISNQDGYDLLLDFFGNLEINSDDFDILLGDEVIYDGTDMATTGQFAYIEAEKEISVDTEIIHVPSEYPHTVDYDFEQQ